MAVKILKSFEEKQQGLQNVTSLGVNDGALFVYDEPQFLYFWGKDTKLYLDIAFLDASGEILEIKEIQPMSQKAVSSTYPALYALEMNHGWFARNGFSVGKTIPLKNRIASKSVVEYVLDRLPIDVYEVVKDVPVTMVPAEYTRGNYSNKQITIWNDDSNPEYLRWTLAHEYWHAFVALGELTIDNGLGKDIHDAVLERIKNSYYDETKKSLAREFMKRHLTLANISSPENVLYEEMFADGLADLVIGGDMQEAIESYASNWIDHFIYEKFGAQE